MSKKFKLYPYLIFIFLILISFREVVTTPGIIGHTWDWNIPNFKEQFWYTAEKNMYIWRDSWETGRYQYFALELVYWFILLPLSFLGGEIVSKIFSMLLIFVAACTMYKLGRDIFGLNYFFATISGIFYMLSPFSYSRLIAGHLPILFGYALLPALVYCYYKIIENYRSQYELPLKYIVLGGLILSFQSVHPSIGVSSLVILCIVIISGLYVTQKRKVLTAFLLVIIISGLLNIFWIVPFMKDYLQTGTLRHGWGLSVTPENEGKVTIESELPYREQFLRSTSQPTLSAISLSLRTGMDTEYVYPVPDKLKTLWILSSMVIPILSFGCLLIDNRKINILPFVIIGLLGITLVSGIKTPIGITIYEFFKNFIPVLYAEFSNMGRWILLIVVAYAVLAPYSLQLLNERRFKNRRFLLKAVTIGLVLIFTSPFISGNLTQPVIKGTTQPLSLKITKINPEDRIVYDFLKGHDDIFRVTYLPPAVLSWPGDTDLSYEWSTTYSPKTGFLAVYNHPVGNMIISNIYSWHPSPYLGKLLGLASVKYIIYPQYDFFISYKDFIPEMASAIRVEGFKNYKPLIDKNLASQKGFIPLELGFKTVSVLQNKHFLPYIYPALNSILINGGINEMFKVVTFGNFTIENNAIFLSNQTNKDRWQFLENYKEMYENRLVGREANEKVPRITFKKINPTRYQILVENATTPFFLIFSESYYPQWKAYIENEPFKFNEIIAEYNNSGVKEAKHEMKFTPMDIFYLFKKPISEDKHFLVNGFANAWYINPKEADKDDNGEFTVTLYFWPQSLFYIGLIISGLTFTGCIGYLIYDRRRLKTP